MKSNFLMGTLALVLMFGFIFAGCDTNSDSGGGGGGGDGDVVQGVTVTQDKARLIVRWGAYSGGTGNYRVYYRMNSTQFSDQNFVRNENGKNWAVVTGLQNNESYSIWVKAEKPDGTWTGEDEAKSGTPKLTDDKPAVPTVNISPTVDGEFLITWEPVPNGDQYNVYIAPNDDIQGAGPAKNPAPIRPSNANNTFKYTTSGDDLNAAGLTYYVWVRATNTQSGSVSDATSRQGVANDAPADGTETGNWKRANDSARYALEDGTWTFYDATNTAVASGTYVYTNPNLRLTRVEGTMPAAEWPAVWGVQGDRAAANIQLRGMSFRVDSFKYTKQ